MSNSIPAQANKSHIAVVSTGYISAQGPLVGSDGKTGTVSIGGGKEVTGKLLG